MDILIIEHSTKHQEVIETRLREAGLGRNIKAAMNGEHGLLCLEHFYTVPNRSQHKILVILNMNTPVADGVSFLKGLNLSKTIPRANISIMVIKSNLGENQINKLQEMGIQNFIDPNNKEELKTIHNTIQPQVRAAGSGAAAQLR